ncbi:lipocalin-like domain-containing protein [Thiorhodovibrio frisius]|uniref:Putative secreted hydrolase n=1 Tax=Thiorhodovibrio frisius TaxID=631362 RepID=H8Z0V2_9GAMM|nr:carotenoid 1,2-hydratase [Thiorhodovibrio frisius]EIC21334.1 putative secreted hydrolase [Thiorhodovibrio frisius]WPL23917.1 putative secreted hydrolase [Thiorhodovibrio frisius]
MRIAASTSVGRGKPARALLAALGLTLLPLLSVPTPASEAGTFTPVTPERALRFPRDFGAHPDYRTEWWYITGWLTDSQGRERGFQVTFFRSATGIGADNPSRFAPRQLILAHAALGDPDKGFLLHDERAARELPPLAGLSRDDTHAWIQDWTLQRDPDDNAYHTQIAAPDFAFDLRLVPPGPPVLNGRAGFSQKSPDPQDASHYYSRPQLEISGTLRLSEQAFPVTGRAWLDHEWSTAYLAEQAAGWDWIGINLHDGGSLMAYQMRRADGSKLWAGGTLVRPGASVQVLAPDDISFTPRRWWQSPRTGTDYPVEWSLDIPGTRLRLVPLMDDQELDARRSTATIYWEGAVRVLEQRPESDKAKSEEIGRGYLEMTGYWQRQSGL